MDHIANIEALEDLIQRYHAREGTFNFHYSHFDLMSWRVWMKEYRMSQADWDRFEIEDYAVRISYTDNSNSYDDYMVLLKDIIAWGEPQEAVNTPSTEEPL